MFQHACQIKRANQNVQRELLTESKLTMKPLIFGAAPGFFRYNVSCSQHYKTSRGRNSGSLTSPPAPSESAARRRGPTRRSSSNTSLNKLSSRHLPAKVKSVLQLACCDNPFLFISLLMYLLQVIALPFPPPKKYQIAKKNWQ